MYYNGRSLLFFGEQVYVGFKSLKIQTDEMTIIPLAPSSLTGSSGLPGDFGRAVLMASPYLALLRAGFCLPPMLPPARCALTAPFHHCLPARSSRTSAVCFLCHFPSGHPDRALPGALPFGVRTFLSPSPLTGLRRSKPSRTCSAVARSAPGAAGGKSELRRAVRRVTPGQGNLKESGTENIQLTSAARRASNGEKVR
jgi:hypothetical protein